MFEQIYNLTIRDINYANHMDHLSILNYLHETRVRFFRSLGYSELDVDGNGSGLVVAELNCLYKNEGFYGDKIIVSLSMEVISPTKLVFNYIVCNQENKILVTSKIRVAFLNAHKKIILIPDYLLVIAKQFN